MSNTKEKLQSIGILPVSLHASMKTLKNNISEAQKVQVDCLNHLESDTYDKNDMQKKVHVLVRLHAAMQENLKTASYSDPIQTVTLVPDKWSRMYCSEYFNSLNTLFEILAKPAPEKRRSYHH